MGSVNPTVQLASVRSQIDRQQSVISILEQELQISILGGYGATYSGLIETIGVQSYGMDPSDVNPRVTGTGSTAGYVAYAGPTGSANPYGLYAGLLDAMLQGAAENYDTSIPLDQEVEQDALRQMLYQARALLGELRVEEQHWNGEVGEEKTRRKELAELTKG